MFPPIAWYLYIFLEFWCSLKQLWKPITNIFILWVNSYLGSVFELTSDLPMPWHKFWSHGCKWTTHMSTDVWTMVPLSANTSPEKEQSGLFCHVHQWGEESHTRNLQWLHIWVLLLLCFKIYHHILFCKEYDGEQWCHMRKQNKTGPSIIKHKPWWWHWCLK